MESSSSPEATTRAPPTRPPRPADEESDLGFLPRTSNEITSRLPKPGLQSQQSQHARIRKPSPASHPRAASHDNTNASFSASVVSQSTKNSNPARGTMPPGQNVRKSSLRNVVRRIFGRKDKEEHSRERTASGHSYHKSDPGLLKAIPEQTQPQSPAPQELPQRTLSAPLHLLDPPSLKKNRSPYAVEFPQSSRLKPLDLSSFQRQFQPRPQPTRRATFQSGTLDDELEATSAARSRQMRGSRHLSVGASFEESDIGMAMTSGTNDVNRRSRSADDLHVAASELRSIEDHAADMRDWRQSYHGSIIRYSTASYGQPELDEYPEERDDTTPLAQPHENIFALHEASDENQYEPPPIPHDSPIQIRPVTAGKRFPADGPRSQGTTFGEDRPAFSASPHFSPASNTREAPDISPQSNDPSPKDNSYQVSPISPPGSSRSNNMASETLPPQTFKALYNMLSDERACRRLLEKQILTLQSHVQSLAQELAEVKFQLSQPIITRASPAYMHQSARQQYVRTTTQTQSMHTREASCASSSDLFPVQGHRVTNTHTNANTNANTNASRFSASATESLRSSAEVLLGREEKDMAVGVVERIGGARRREGGNGEEQEEEVEEGTPYEVFQTPAEDNESGGWSQLQGYPAQSGRVG